MSPPHYCSYFSPSMAGPQEPSLFGRHQRARGDEAMACIGHSYPGSSAAAMQAAARSYQPSWALGDSLSLIREPLMNQMDGFRKSLDRHPFPCQYVP